MKFVHFKNNDRHHFGKLQDSGESLTVHSLGILGCDLPSTTRDIIWQWEKLDLDSRPLLTTFSIEQVTTLQPIDDSQKLICIGRNYAEHAEEMGAQSDELPVVFNKFPSCVIGPEQNIHLPTISQQVDFEAELVVVIGRVCHNVAIDHAIDCVFGYCCGNDVTARDWQKGRPGGQWLLGKSFDTFAPIGPWLVTRDEVKHDELDIRLALNGTVMQSSNTRNLIFGVEYLISHISQFCTLLPGDLIFTGTPAGVGAARDPQVFLKHGDTVEVEIDGLGVLRNHVV